MVVDDDSDIREAITGVLEAEGYTVLSVENGERALQLLEKGQRPCVVLLDLMMPVMSGWDFMKAVNRQRDLDDMPIVVVSAFSEQGAPGARRTLKKPLDVEQLLKAVAEFCCCEPRPRQQKN
jgi:CheY-like chemotaxis protein